MSDGTVKLHFAKDDTEWSSAVKAKYSGHCAWLNCSSHWGCGAHHVWNRGDKILRLVIENGVYLCAKHHQMVQTNSKFRKQMEQLLIGPKTFFALEEFLLMQKKLEVGITKMPTSHNMGIL